MPPRSPPPVVAVCVCVQGFRKAGQLAAARLHELGVGLDETDPKAARTLLEKCAKTSLNSKLISRYQVTSPPPPPHSLPLPPCVTV